MPFPKKIFLIGVMGSGKTYWGQRLANYLNYNYFDIDEEIEMIEQKTITEIFKKEGEQYFREKEKQVLKFIIRYSPFVISCGGGTPYYFDNMEQLKKSGMVVWLNPPLEILVSRLLNEKEKRPLIQAALSKKEIKNILAELIKKRKPFYTLAHFTIEEPYPTIELFKTVICIQ